MAGSDRCSGLSPITTSTTTRSGVTVSASGATAIPTSMPASSGPMAMTVSRPICRNVRRDDGKREALRSTSFAAATAAKSSVCRSTRSQLRCSRPMRKGQASTISAMPRSRRRRSSARPVLRRSRRRRPVGWRRCSSASRRWRKPSISFSRHWINSMARSATSRRRASMRWPTISVARQLPTLPVDRWSRIAERLRHSIGPAPTLRRGFIPTAPSALRCRCSRIPARRSAHRSRRLASPTT
ncbi:hypothetical protein ACVWWP_002868 [Bradyrhizobium sp. LM3.6]